MKTITPTPAMLERFWAKVDKSGECWIWTAKKNPNGYGIFSVGGRDSQRGAHRVSYTIAFGPIPDGLIIDHRCHNRSCVNPSHLRAATVKQNGENTIAVTAQSGYRGVRRAGKSGWRGCVRHNREFHYTTTFATVEEANEAVIELRNQLFTHNDADRAA